MRALVLAALLVAAPARAHETGSPLALTLSLAPAQAVLAVRLRLVGETARELGEQLDADASGTLDRKERARLAALLSTRVRAALALTSGGQPQPLSPGTPRLELEAGEIFFALELTAPALRGEVVLAVEWPDPRAITPVVVRGAGPYRGGEASRGAPLRFRINEPRR